MSEMEMTENKTSNGGVAVVIFGVTGDLTHRKLIPALYELERGSRLPDPLYVIGFARRDWNDEKMRSVLHEGIMDHSRTKPVEEAVVDKLLSRSCYVQSSFDDADGYRRLAGLLEKLNVSICIESHRRLHCGKA